MNDINKQEKFIIEDLIYEIRGKQVMLDSDLARLYECSNGTKDINKAVKRNIERFPEDFMFQLTTEEFYLLRCQNGTSKTRGGRKYNPYVFTEQGVAMLSGVLNSSIAINMSIKIINTFVIMRKHMSNNILEQRYINDTVLKHEKEIKLIKDYLVKLNEKEKTNEIYFDGQIYDAYSKIQQIFAKAKTKIVIIDSYADYTLLDIIKRINVDVIIITKSNNLLTSQDIKKYNKQYHNLNVIFNDTFHDRYFILDDETIYHCGTSINKIGYKTFSINIIGDQEVMEQLLIKVSKIILKK